MYTVLSTLTINADYERHYVNRNSTCPVCDLSTIAVLFTIGLAFLLRHALSVGPNSVTKRATHD